ncbi:MAG TPA: hypothetical protein VGF55_33215 [Gemmataceae bacterium]|jgi:hypothetical protein
MHIPAIALQEQEVVWDVSPAGFGGVLYITDRRLCYETPHGGGSGEILFRDVTAVRPWNLLGLVPLGVAVTTRDGRRHTLRVRHRRPLLALIAALCPADGQSVPAE